MTIAVVDQVQEGAVHTGILRKLRVEGCGYHSSLPDGDRVFISAFGGDDFDARADTFDLGSADEDHLDGPAGECGFAGADRAVDLASIGVAADADVERAEPRLVRIGDFFRQHNGSGTGAEGRLEPHELFELLKTLLAEDFQECTGLATGDDEAFDVVELLRLFNEHNFSAQLFEPLAVSVEIALEGKDSDFHKNL